MITYICHLQVPAANAAAAARLLADVRDRSLAEEPGVTYYDFAQSSEQPGRWVVVEVYRDVAAHSAHMAAPWVIESIPRMRELIEGEFEIRRYVSPEEEHDG
jgi:quinol monooxygenase YgiN